MPNKVKTAMIFAAGLGKRLRPLTDEIPKPLIKINGKPLIQYSIELLIEAGIKEILINGYYKFDVLESYISSLSYDDIKIRLIKENDRLETGGGLKNALNYTDSQHLLTCNSDVILDNFKINPAKNLVQNWNSDNAEILMLLIDKKNTIGYSGAGDFTLNKSDIVRNKDNNDYIFTGLEIINSNIINNIDKKVFSLSEIFNNCLLKKTLKAIIFEGSWIHVGDETGFNLAQQYFQRELMHSNAG